MSRPYIHLFAELQPVGGPPVGLLAPRCPHGRSCLLADVVATVLVFLALPASPLRPVFHAVRPMAEKFLGVGRGTVSCPARASGRANPSLAAELGLVPITTGSAGALTAVHVLRTSATTSRTSAPAPATQDRAKRSTTGTSTKPPTNSTRTTSPMANRCTVALWPPRACAWAMTAGKARRTERRPPGGGVRRHPPQVARTPEFPMGMLLAR